MRKMKDSGVEWIGEIPEEWEVIPMKRFIDKLDGGAWGQEPANNSNDMICIRVADFNYVRLSLKKNNLFTVRNYDSQTISRLLLTKGDILVEKSGGGENTPVGRSIIFQENFLALYANFMDRIRVLNKYSNRFFQYVWTVFYLNGYSKLYIKQTTGIQNLDIKSLLARESIAFPHLNRQNHIADFLDRKCAQIDAIIAKQQQTIEKLKLYKQSVITEAVTKGLDPDVPMKDSGIEWLGEIPENWNTYRIANLYDERIENGTDDLPILTVSINSGISDRELSDDEKERAFVRSEDRTKYKRVYPGDLAYNMMRAWQGAFGAVRVDGMISPAYVVARPNLNGVIDSRYIEYLLRTPIAIEEMHRYSHGIADFRLRLYWPKFKNIRICLPSLQEQKGIADCIDYESAKIEDVIKRIQLFIDKLTQYKKSLIYEAVTGKLEV